MHTLQAKIKRLDPHLINQIAAGEVIERPAAIIKELVENALDANAKRIEIELEEAGKSSIIIRDNGHGITKDDISLAFERHATSKLPDADLFAIHTFGFRGEALPSIASISKVECITRTEQDEYGSKLTIEAGKMSLVTLHPHPVGTTIIVRDLFFATPARLKFLKTTTTELTHIKDVVCCLAMANPGVAFTLKSEGKLIYDFVDTMLPERIAQVMGNDFFQNSTPVFYEHDGYKLEGMITLPTYSKSQVSTQYIYVNNRWVKDKNIAGILRVAYQDRLMHGRYPMVVLFLTLDNREVDVNVHPSKTEVRFRDGQMVRSVFVKGIKQALDAVQHSASPMYGEMALEYFKKSQHFNETMPSLNSSAIARPIFKDSYLSSKVTASKPFATILPKEEIVEQLTEYPLGIAKAQLFNTYIVAQTKDALLLIDQHAAHERIVYEQLKNRWLQKEELNRQVLLNALYINVSDKDFQTYLIHQGLLSSMGFRIDSYPTNTLVVHSVPAVEGLGNYEQLVKDILTDLDILETEVTATEAVWERLSTCACHNSIRAGKSLSVMEMNELLRQMEVTQKAAMCNHGRPTYVKLDKIALEKLFHRS